MMQGLVPIAGAPGLGERPRGGRVVWQHNGQSKGNTPALAIGGPKAVLQLFGQGKVASGAAAGGGLPREKPPVVMLVLIE